MTQDQALKAIADLQKKFEEYTEACESYIAAMQRHIVELQAELDAKSR